MAYDLLFRKRTRANWSRHSYCGPRGVFLLAEYEWGQLPFAPDPTPATDEEKQFIAKLAVLKMSADAGNKKAAKEWKATLARLDLVKKKATQGDEKSKHLIVVLTESGIFDGVQAMSVTGDDVPPEFQGRRDARKILDDAAQAKTISHADFKRAIALHAGPQATEAERAAIGSKMLEFLSKRQIKFSS